MPQQLPRSIPVAVQLGVAMFRAQARTFMVVAFIGYVPSTLLELVKHAGGVHRPLAILMSIASLLANLLSSICLLIVADRALRQDNIGVLRVVQQALPRYVRYVGWSVLYGCCVMLGGLAVGMLAFGLPVILRIGFAVIPVLYMMVRFTFYDVAVVLEPAGTLNPFSRSGMLIQGSVWMTAAIVLLKFLPGAIVVGAVLFWRIPMLHPSVLMADAAIALLVVPVCISAYVVWYHALAQHVDVAA